MPTKLMTFAADPETAALLFPFTAAPLPDSYGGWFIGPQLGFRRAVKLAPWLWQQNKLIGSTQCEIVCEIDHGKSTLVKSIALQACMTQGKPKNGVARPLDVEINSQRREGKGDEYEVVIKKAGGFVTELRHASYNPFVRALYKMHDSDEVSEVDMLETAVMLGEIADQSPIFADENLAYQIAVRRMLHEDLMYPGYLEHLLRSQTDADYKEYFRGTNAALLHDIQTMHPDRVDFIKKLQIQLEQPVSMTAHAFSDATNRAANRMGAVLRGKMGGSFGSKDAYRRQRDGRPELRDWSGLNQQAQAGLASFFMHMETIAIARGRQDELPDVSIGDESHARMTVPAVARADDQRSRMARQGKTFRIRLNQYAGDTARIGEPESQLRSHGVAIDNSQGFHIFGKQPNKPEIKDYLASKNLGEPDIGYITQHMLPYEFAIVIPRRPVIYAKHTIGPKLRSLVGTNSASAGQLERVPPSADELARFNRIRFANAKAQDAATS